MEQLTLCTDHPTKCPQLISWYHAGQKKTMLFCLEGETTNGKAKCSQHLIIPRKQVLPLQQMPAPCIYGAGALVWISNVPQRPMCWGGLEPRLCTSRDKTSCTRRPSGKQQATIGGRSPCSTYSRAICPLSAS